MKKHGISLVFVILLVLLSTAGCTGQPSPEEEIFTTLEAVVTLEKDFKEQQAPLVELEKQEKELYDEIISLGMKEFETIVSLSKEALSIVEEREQHLELEYESIQKSKTKFNTVNEIIVKIEDAETKKEANEIVDIMNKRYASYEDLYKSYKMAINNDKELYQMFQNEDLTLEQLESQINKINESYDKVIAANETFNDFTKKYNDSKLTFYKNAGLKVEYENEN